MWIYIGIAFVVTSLFWILVGASHGATTIVAFLIALAVFSTVKGTRRWAANLDDMIEDEEYFDRQVQNMGLVADKFDELKNKALDAKNSFEETIGAANTKKTDEGEI